MGLHEDYTELQEIDARMADMRVESAEINARWKQHVDRRSQLIGRIALTEASGIDSEVDLLEGEADQS